MLTNQMQKIDEAVERANLVNKFFVLFFIFIFIYFQPLEFSDRLFKNSSTTEILMFKKQLENKFNSLVQTMPDTNGQTSSFELEFVSNFQVKQQRIIKIIFPSLSLGYSNRCSKYIWLCSIITGDNFFGKKSRRKFLVFLCFFFLSE
jgi:hypothetical protein